MTWSDHDLAFLCLRRSYFIALCITLFGYGQCFHLTSGIPNSNIAGVLAVSSLYNLSQHFSPPRLFHYALSSVCVLLYGGLQ
jgi:hypothetical protein